jgi:hypothetical protein
VAKRLGMQYVGRTDKYFDLELEVYRLRPADLRAVDVGDWAAGSGTGKRQ